MGCTRREFLALASMGTVAGVAACTPQKEPPVPQENGGKEAQDVDVSKH